MALADGPTVLDDHGADKRVGARLATRFGGQLNRSREVALVALCGQRFSQVAPVQVRN
jgi:hypothetical protein